MWGYRGGFLVVVGLLLVGCATPAPHYAPTVDPVVQRMMADGTTTAVARMETATAVAIYATSQAVQAQATGTAGAMMATQAAQAQGTATSEAGYLAVALEQTRVYHEQIVMPREQAANLATIEAVQAQRQEDVFQMQKRRDVAEFYYWMRWVALGVVTILVLAVGLTLVQRAQADFVADDNGNIIAHRPDFVAVRQARIIQQARPEPLPEPIPVRREITMRVEEAKTTRIAQTSHTAAEWQALATAVYEANADAVAGGAAVMVTKRTLKGVCAGESNRPIYANIDRYFNDVLAQWRKWGLIDLGQIVTPNGLIFLGEFEPRFSVASPPPQGQNGANGRLQSSGNQPQPTNRNQSGLN